VVALSVMVFTSTVMVLGSIYEAPSSFAANEGYVISTPGAPTVFSSSVDVGLLDFLPEASPEIFAFSAYDGVPFVIRGVDWKVLANDTELRGNEAVVGSALMQRLGLVPPCDVPVTVSYHSGFEVLRVMGEYKSTSAVRDELLVSLDTARSLSGMRSDRVSIIRLDQVSSEVKDTLMPNGPRFAIYDFASSLSRVAIGQEFSLSVFLKNWGTEKGRVNLSFFDHDSVGAALYGENISLAAGEEIRFSHPFSFDVPGTKDLIVRIDGRDAQSRLLSVEVVSEYVAVSGPAAVALNSSFEVLVTDYASRPVLGAEVRFLNQTEYTDATGIAVLDASELGTRSVDVVVPGFTSYNWSVVVYDSSTYPNEFKPTITELAVVPNEFRETESAQVRLVLENYGRQAGVFVDTVYLDSHVVVAEVSMPLGPGESKVALFRLTGVGEGSHVVSLGTASATFSVHPWYVEDPDMVKMAIKYGGSLRISSAASIPIVEAAKLTQGDIQVALASIGGISGTLAALSMTSIFSKEVHEARGKLGILRTIGASRAVIRRMVTRQSLAFSFPGALIGIGLGLAVSAVLIRSGLLMMFGHSLRLNIDLSVVPSIVIGTLLICLASALASAEIAARSTPISSIRKTEEEGSKRRSVDDVLGGE